MVGRRDQARGQRGGGRAEADAQRPGLAVRREVVQQPQLTAALVDHPGAVRAGLAGVLAIVVGVPEQAGTVEPAGVHVARALVVRQEGQPAADQHGAGELAGQAGQDALERRAVRRGPQPARGAAPVTLPERRITSPAAVEQGLGCLLQGCVRDRAERQPLRRAAVHRDRVGPALPLEGLAARAQRDDLAAGCPAADLGGLVTPVGQAPGPLAVHPGQVDLGRAVAPAAPGHPLPVPREPRVRGLGPVRGEPPAPPAVHRRQPHIVLGHEREQVTVNMRKAEVPG